MTRPNILGRTIVTIAVYIFVINRVVGGIFSTLLATYLPTIVLLATNRSLVTKLFNSTSATRLSIPNELDSIAPKPQSRSRLQTRDIHASARKTGTNGKTATVAAIRPFVSEFPVVLYCKQKISTVPLSQSEADRSYVTHSNLLC